MACLSRSSYTKRAVLNRLRLVYKRSISFTKLASCVQKWRFVYKYVLFNLQTSISSYKLAFRITTHNASLLSPPTAAKNSRKERGYTWICEERPRNSVTMSLDRILELLPVTADSHETIQIKERTFRTY